MTSDEQRWVVQPGDARIDIAIGRDAKLSPEVREALVQLAQAVEQQHEVQGYAVCDEITVAECEILVHCQGVTWM